MECLLSPSQTTLNLPEEIVEYIFSLALFPQLASDASPLSLLLVCRSFHRIAKPLLYAFLHLRSREQSKKLAKVFVAQPHLGAYIRTIRVDGPSASPAFLAVTDILTGANERFRRVLDVVDVRLVDERNLSSNRTLDGTQAREDLERLYSALRACPDTRCFIMRQDGYLSCNTTISFSRAVAAGVKRWHSLEIADLRMRPTPIPSPPSGPQPDPLATALAEAPNLRILRARQPTLLNSFLIDAAKNIKLERIELVDNAASLSDSDSCFYPSLRSRYAILDWPHRYHGYSTSWPSPRYPQYSAPPPRWTTGDVGVDAGVMEDARAELEAQLEREPKTLFLSQIVAHPRLNALIQAGRLRLIVDRLLMERYERCLVGSSCHGSGRRERGNGSSERCLCVSPGVSYVGLPGLDRNGCPPLRAGR